MNYYQSIKFTQEHHNQIAELLDYDSMDAEDLKKSTSNLKKFLEENNAPRYLYVIRHGKTNNYKIGVTNDIEKRIKTHQTGNPFTLKFIFGVEADLTDYLGREIAYLERFFHKNYDDLRLHGEWFKLNKKHLSDMCFFLENDRDLAIFHDNPDELSLYQKRINNCLIQQGWIDKEGNLIDWNTPDW